MRRYGGWDEIKEQRKAVEYRKGDLRILGKSDFVEELLAEERERYERKYRLKAQKFDLQKIAKRVGGLLKMSPDDVFRRDKERRAVQTHGLLCYWATEEVGMTQTALARRLKVTQPAISLAVRRGEQLAKQKGRGLVG